MDADELIQRHLDEADREDEHATVLRSHGYKYQGSKGGADLYRHPSGHDVEVEAGGLVRKWHHYPQGVNKAVGPNGEDLVKSGGSAAALSSHLKSVHAG